MANVLAGRVWILDSTGVITLDPIKIRSIQVGTSITIKDNKASPNTVFTATSAGWFPDLHEWFQGGIQVTAISGVTNVYIE